MDVYPVCRYTPPKAAVSARLLVLSVVTGSTGAQMEVGKWQNLLEALSFPEESVKKLAECRPYPKEHSTVRKKRTTEGMYLL